MKRVRGCFTSHLEGRRPTRLGGALVPIVAVGLALAACEETTEDNPDAGPAACPGPLREATPTCTAAGCSATEGLKTFGEAELAAEVATDWIVPTWASSEVAGEAETTTIEYAKTTPGGLTPEARTALKARTLQAVTARARSFFGDATFEEIYGSGRADRIRAEAAIRAQQLPARIDLSAVSGTAIRARSLVPGGVLQQGATCSRTAPTSCGATSLCVIPEDAAQGTCASRLTLKFPTSETAAVDVPATVRKVGRFGAIVVDDANGAAISTSDTDALLDRFDQHIAVLDHAFFGTPKDRDGNGVVIIFLTGRVADRGGPNLAGFFQSNDLLPTAMNPASNAAEILYMQGPSASITLDQLSGTIGHEYQHLINYYAKNAEGPSEGEDVWLDEGLATFAEDVLGYGSDSFKNVAAFLGAVDQTSLTGNGMCPDGAETDSTCRRGMAHLLVRYYFEQKGGATFGASAGEFTDRGGVAAVRALVQSTDTGTLLFTQERTGQAFDAWLGDLITTVAVDGAGFDGVSCNPKYSLRAPETSGYTNYQRGIDLRTPFTAANGMTINLTGPNTATLETESIPVGANSGEVRTVRVTSGKVKISIGGSVDYRIGFHAIPAVK